MLFRSSAEAMSILTSYDWPGNVRELYALMERLVVLSERNKIAADAVRFHLTPTTRMALPEGTRRHSPETVREALRHAGGDKRQAALALGVHRSTLWRYIKEYGLQPQVVDWGG